MSFFQSINFQKQVLPHLIAVLVFYAATILYFSDVIFKGEVIKQGDTIQWSGAASKIFEHRNQYGEEPLWTPNMFGGMPSYTVSTQYSGDLMEYVDAVFRGGLPYPVAIVFVGLVSYYITLLCFGVSSWLAMIGALAFALSSFNFISLEAGHNSKVRAMMLAPMIIGGFRLMLNRKYLIGLVLATIAVSLQVKAGHYQITYYTGILIGVYVLSEIGFSLAGKGVSIKTFSTALGLLLVAGLLGLSTNIGRLWTVQEYTQYSMRGKAELKPKDKSMPTDGGLNRDYVFDWSHEKAEVFTLLIPNAYGGSSQEKIIKKGPIAKALSSNQIDQSQFPAAPTYWGSMPFTSGPIYAGAIVVYLFVLGLFLLDAREKTWLWIATLLSLLLSMGKFFESLNFTLYDIFPYYSKFRTVTMTIYIAQVCMPIMGMLTLSKIESSYGNKDLQKKFMTGTAVVLGLLMVLAMLPSMFFDFQSEKDGSYGLPEWLVSALVEERESMFQADALRSLLFIAASAAAIFVVFKNWVKPMVAFALVGLLSTLDLWAVDRRYLNKENFVKPSEIQASSQEPEESDKMILLDKGHYRVLNLQNPFAETKTSQFHNSLGGYSPAKIRRYQDLIENDLTQEIEGLTKALQSGQFAMEDFKKYPVLRMLNCKYLKYGAEKNNVITNPFAAGPAWFVSEVKNVSTPDEDIASLPNLDVIKTAVVDIVKFPSGKATQYDNTQGQVRITQTKANHLIYETQNPKEGFLVMSEIYYPAGWKAVIDGKEAELLRADYALRALIVPAGNHKIELVFEPKSYHLGNQIMGVSSIIVILLGLSAVALSLKKPTKKD